MSLFINIPVDVYLLIFAIICSCGFVGLLLLIYSYYLYEKNEAVKDNPVFSDYQDFSNK